MSEHGALANKPLAEAIFEVRWSVGMPGIAKSDPLYELMIGALREQLRPVLPSYVRLPAAAIAGIPHIVQHQFRASEGGWPLVQIGNGVLTANETAGYRPETFVELCNTAFNAVSAFWRSNETAPTITTASLRYVNAVETDQAETPMHFLSKLGFNLRIDERIHRSGKLDKEPNNLQMSASFPTNEPKGRLLLNFSKGAKSGNDAMVWETNVVAEQAECESFSNNPQKWLADAHLLSHEVFFSMIEGELLEKFK
jgi:uncharacterized protein (TIGR04255 family)